MTFTPSRLSWRPTDAPSILLCWEADKSLRVVGNQVVAWTDQVSQLTAVPASGSTGITTSTSINGQQCLSFTGSAGLAVNNVPVVGAKTFAIVCRLNGIPSNATFGSVLLLKDVAGTTFSEPLVFFNNISGYQSVSFVCDLVTTGLAAGSAQTLDTKPHEYVLAYNGGSFTATGSYGLIIDGVAQAVVQSSTFAHVAADVGSIGSRVNASGVVVDPAAVDLAAIYVFKGVLDAYTISQLHIYCVNKWGV